MDPKRRRTATVKRIGHVEFWRQVALYRLPCRKCYALPGEPCHNWTRQRKAICSERGTPAPDKVATSRPKELTQGLLFRPDDATSRGK